jgi:hypothetical protein
MKALLVANLVVLVAGFGLVSWELSRVYDAIGFVSNATDDVKDAVETAKMSIVDAVKK